MNHAAKGRQKSKTTPQVHTNTAAYFAALLCHIPQGTTACILFFFKALRHSSPSGNMNCTSHLGQKKQTKELVGHMMDFHMSIHRFLPCEPPHDPHERIKQTANSRNLIQGVPAKDKLGKRYDNDRKNCKPTAYLKPTRNQFGVQASLHSRRSIKSAGQPQRPTRAVESAQQANFEGENKNKNANRTCFQDVRRANKECNVSNAKSLLHKMQKSV